MRHSASMSKEWKHKLLAWKGILQNGAHFVQYSMCAAELGSKFLYCYNQFIPFELPIINMSKLSNKASGI